MQVRFGLNSAKLRDGVELPVIWDSQKVINGHMLIVGKSGTGKTYSLKNIIDQLKAQVAPGRFRVHIMDVHGDIDIPGASIVKFSESTQYGFNPLAINPDPDFGGVRKKIQSFLAAINRTSRKLGSKQESSLRNILMDLYSANGFYDGKPESWKTKNEKGEILNWHGKNKKHPTLEDAYRYANFKMKAMFLGTNSRAVATLELLNKKALNIYAKAKQQHKVHYQDEMEKLKVDLKNLGEEAVELYQEYIHSIQNGMELNDLIRYDSKDVLKSVVERLENLNAVGIFKPEPPPFDRTKAIWRYDIKALSLDEKKLFVSFVLEEIFLRALQKGIQDDIKQVIVLDEAHLFFNDDPDNITNIIAKEARKFGIGLFCASQSPTHFSDDFISNVGTKIILGIDQMYWDGSVRKLKIEQQALEWIQPQHKMVMQMNTKGELKNRFVWVQLDKNNNK